jgi:formylglycine-generating enzyme required for sulfatase activity
MTKSDGAGARTGARTGLAIVIGLLVVVAVAGVVGYLLSPGHTYSDAPGPVPVAASAPVAGAGKVIDLGNGVKLEMVLIPAGRFTMGSDKGDSGENPVHEVWITKPFYFGKYEVTQEQWQAVMANNPSKFKGAKRPVETVSWDECREFIRKLNGLGQGTFRLPTEAEWEYACRAGSTTVFSFGDDEKGLTDYAWFRGNSGLATHDVGGKKPNAWGLYDMHGNVWEWCADWYGDDYYRKSPRDDPTGPAAGSYRVLRSGPWCRADVSWGLRSASRGSVVPGRRDDDAGMRLALIAGGPWSVPTKPPDATKPPPPRGTPLPRPSPEGRGNTSPKPPAEKAIDLGNGVKLELVLIPAGKFIMGTPAPTPVDEEGFRNKVVTGQAVFAVGVGVLLVLLGTVVVRAIRKSRRLQYSLARLVAMTMVAGVALLGGLHWHFSAKAFIAAKAQYLAMLARYQAAEDDEKPAHEVTLTKPFYLGRFEVTQEQYQQVMGANPSAFKGRDLPVEQVSWDDAREFCRKASRCPLTPASLRSSRPSPAGGEGTCTVRLPTEAEWEYACRAGTTTKFNSGDEDTDLEQAAWFGKNSGWHTNACGQKKPNAWGLYDMHGNVWEWVQDYFDDKYYGESPSVDPKGPASGGDRVLRGGGWDIIPPGYCRAALRHRRSPGDRYTNGGFRLALDF